MNSINENLQSQLEDSQKELASANDHHQSQVFGYEEALQKKSKEIYDLTVQIGALKEENHQIKRELEELKFQYEERLKSQ